VAYPTALHLAQVAYGLFIVHVDHKLDGGAHRLAKDTEGFAAGAGVVFTVGVVGTDFKGFYC